MAGSCSRAVDIVKGGTVGVLVVNEGPVLVLDGTNCIRYICVLLLA